MKLISQNSQTKTLKMFRMINDMNKEVSIINKHKFIKIK